MSKVGILYDNISGNTGDVAIGLSLKKILSEIGVEFDVLIPGNFNPIDYDIIIIGGGHLIRPSPDFFYDKFKVPGPHVLNAVGILDTPQDLHYLEDYSYLTVRSSWDKEKLSYIKKEVHVVPCTTMLLEDLEDIPVKLEGPCLGIHLLPHTFNEAQEERFVEWLSTLPFKIYFIPITFYNQDYIYMMRISSRVKNSVLLPIMKPLEIFTLIGKLDYFISCSLHGGVFAYIHNVPFILYNYNEKMFFFMKDRGLERYTFTDLTEMVASFEHLLMYKPDYSQNISEDLDKLKEHIERLKEILPSDGIEKIEGSDESQINHQIQNLHSQLIKYEAHIFDITNQLSEATSRAKKRELDLTNQLREATSRAKQLDNEIAEMKRSIVWQIMMKFHNSFIEPLLPHETRRRGMYDLCLSGGRIIADEGIRSFASKFKQYMFSRMFLRKDSFKPLSTEELENMRKQCATFKYKPKISIITPVWNTKDKWLKSAIDSVLNQVYSNWELCIVDDASNKPYIKKLLENYQRKDTRIKVKYLSKNSGVSGASNEALSLTTGEFVGFLDHDDMLLPNALYEVVFQLNQSANVDFVYSDEILISEEGKPIYAYFRPDFSLDYMLSHCYIVHFVVIRSRILKKIGGFRNEFCVSQDYDLFLRVISETRNILHIPKILYKWRQYESSTGHQFKEKVMESSRKALQDFADREGIKGVVYCTKYFNFFRLKREILDRPKISIIIPTKDRIDLLRRCVESIQAKSSYDNYEVIIVDNLSQEEETAAYLNLLQEKYDNYRVLKFNEKFNYSKLNNYAAKFASGDHLLFLNNDVEILNCEWLEAMLEQSQRDDIGCVGAKLLYPDKKIQHVGVIVGWGGRAEHIYKWYDSNDIGYMGHFICIRTYSAVTAACLMIQNAIFEEVGGFDENYEIGFGDVDFCLRVRELGYENLFTPYAELIHYESATRGTSLKFDPHPKDTKNFIKKWRKYIQKGDPYYNPNLPLDKYDITPYICFD